jgi:hypothetical protein
MSECRVEKPWRRASGARKKILLQRLGQSSMTMQIIFAGILARRRPMSNAVVT